MKETRKFCLPKQQLVLMSKAKGKINYISSMLDLKAWHFNTLDTKYDSQTGY